MRDFAGQLAGVTSAAIAGHVRPDGDCAGSCLAVYNYIKASHPQIDVSLYLEPIPNIFRFLTGAKEIISDFSEDKAYDLFIALDCGDAARLGGAVKYFHRAKKTICVDHHISNGSFADENHIVPDASSTSELVFSLIGEENVTKEIAECIYVGIVHDTGVFQYSCTSKRTMEIAGMLMECGIDYSKIIDETFYAKTFAQNQILGKALLESRLYLDGRVIASVVTAEDMRRYQVMPRHLDGIVNQLRVTKGVEAAVFLYELPEGGYKASMRTNRLVDAARIAAVFGGGGHVRAAGFSVDTDAKDMLARIIEEIKKQL